MADKTKVDGYLGSGSWDEWAKLQRDQDAAELASDDWNRWFSLLSLGPAGDLVWKCREDIILLDQVGDDYSAATNAISLGTRLSKDQLKSLRLAYRKTIDLLDGDNRIIKAISDAGVPRTIVALQLADLKDQSDIASATVILATKAIEAAKRIKHKAEAATFLDTAGLTLTLFFPEIAITTKIAVGIGKWATGKYLLGLDELAADDAASSVDRLMSFKTLRQYKAGWAHPGVQVYLDLERVMEEDDTLVEAVKTIKAAEKEIETLAALIDSRKSLLVTLKGNLKNVELKCKAKRSDLLFDAQWAMACAGYDLGTMYLAWRS